jgi:hypothetical protein
LRFFKDKFYTTTISQKIIKSKSAEQSLRALIPVERIASRIFLIRGVKVMIDRDLAELYGVLTKVFNQAVRRNIDRFPDDFMFQLSKKEFNVLRSQFVTLKGRGKHPKYLPLAFTEQGVAMLSSVLNSKRAVQVNIQIMRTFTRLREMLITHKDLQEKIEKMEAKYDKQFKVVFDAIKQLIMQGNKPKAEIGFKVKDKSR